MLKRPTTDWRDTIEEQTAQIAAGELEKDDAWALKFWPLAMIDAADPLMASFEATLAGLGTEPTDESILAAVKDLVLALNTVDDEHGHPFETSEREQLCEYIEKALEDAGIDVAALTARQGIDRHGITDKWRNW